MSTHPPLLRSLLMSFRRFLPALAALLLGLAVLPARAADGPVAAGDEEVLKSIGLTADGPALLEFFKRRSEAKVTRARVTARAKEGGNKEGTKKRKAVADPRVRGPPVLPPPGRPPNERKTAGAAPAHKKQPDARTSHLPSPV